MYALLRSSLLVFVWTTIYVMADLTASVAGFRLPAPIHSTTLLPSILTAATSDTTTALVTAAGARPGRLGRIEPTRLFAGGQAGGQGRIKTFEDSQSGKATKLSVEALGQTPPLLRSSRLRDLCQMSKNSLQKLGALATRRGDFARLHLVPHQLKILQNHLVSGTLIGDVHAVLTTLDKTPLNPAKLLQSHIEYAIKPEVAQVITIKASFPTTMKQPNKLCQFIK